MKNHLTKHCSEALVDKSQNISENNSEKEQLLKEKKLNQNLTNKLVDNDEKNETNDQNFEQNDESYQFEDNHISCEQESISEEKEQCSETEKQHKTQEKMSKTSKTFDLSSDIIK